MMTGNLETDSFKHQLLFPIISQFCWPVKTIVHRGLRVEQSCRTLVPMKQGNETERLFAHSYLEDRMGAPSLPV